MSKGALLTQLLVDAQPNVLGPMLVDPGVIGEVLLQVSDSDFPEGRYRLIFQAIRRLYNAGRLVDGVTVNEALGGNYGDLLADIINQTVTTANVMEHVRVLRQASRQRQLAELGRQMAEAEEPDVQSRLLDQMNSLSCDKAGARIATLSDCYSDFLDRHADGKRPDYLTWGITALDERVYVEPGDLVVLGGYPSAGKTALALQMAYHIAGGKRVGYFYYENNDRKLFDRLLAARTLVSFGKVKRHELNEEDFRAIISMQDRLTAPALEFVDASGMSVADIRAVALGHHYDLIVTDYLQKIRGSKRRNSTDFERVSEISSDLQDLGKQTGVTVLALSQLSRPPQSNGKTPAPGMHSFRQSGQIEQDADVALLLYKECEKSQADDPEPPRLLKIGKNKEGEAGVALRMYFDGNTQTFSRIAPQQEPARRERQKPRQVSFWDPVAEEDLENPFLEEGGETP